MPAGTLAAELRSPRDQEIALQFPRCPLRIESAAAVRESPLGADYRRIALRASETCRLAVCMRRTCEPADRPGDQPCQHP